jgi:Zinc knuckle
LRVAVWRKVRVLGFLEIERQQTAVKKNEIAMASFSIAFTTEKAMNIIYSAYNENWPEGEAYLVVQELMKRYPWLDTVLKIEMHQRLSRIKMKKGMDLSILFETLTSIQNQFLGPGKRLPADEIIAIVLDVATEEYRPCLTVERKLKGDKFTVEDLERAMVEEYRQFTRSQFCKESSEGELLLFQFQGSSYNCGKSGHRANECPNESSLKGTKEKTHNSGKFQGKCGTCGLKGHKSKDCWNKEENKDKRPANWKKKGQEKAAITVRRAKKAKKSQLSLDGLMMIWKDYLPILIYG